jgi:CheY-specific phosphatase CheX
LKYEPANATYPATPSIIANIIPIGAQSGGSLYTQTIIAYRTTSQASGSTMNLSTNGTGIGGLIEPTTPNATWNVTIDTIATVIGITGDVTGIVIGDTYSETTRLVFKKVSGISTLVAIVSSEAGFDTSMTTALMNYSVGGSQNLNLQFQFPTFVGAGLIEINAISKLEIVEVTY